MIVLTIRIIFGLAMFILWPVQHFFSCLKNCIPRIIESYRQDRAMGIDCTVCDDVQHTVMSPHRVISDTFDALALSPDDVVVDLGCGTGRFICMAARRGARTNVGVESNSGWARRANKNARHIARITGSDVKVIHGDARSLSDNNGTVYYLFNPFDKEVFIEVIASIKNSLTINPRRIRIVYAYPMYGYLIDSAGWLKKIQMLKTDKFDVIIWESL